MCIEKLARSHVNLVEFNKIGMALESKDVATVLSTGNRYLAGSDVDDPTSSLSVSGSPKHIGKQDRRPGRLTQER